MPCRCHCGLLARRQLIAQIGEQRRIPLEWREIPQQVDEAFLAAEDDRFFEHQGFD